MANQPTHADHADSIFDHLETLERKAVEPILKDIHSLQEWVKRHPYLSTTVGTVSPAILYIVKQKWMGKGDK